ncbi:inovirus-type Gp2 protein [Halomonas vilamensis]|uniref:Inovirus-type Gp2 protein n=1 Tax=Vreelandella vilamensis TaxID=531309 RepID=A0ABU1HA82_9GAMM|nr:inovirus-type Gp2 protein [Halomonas vilamensis]MDR5900403.1 inovirus-type Gp2 protein [Halomonas vilamensis]
MHDTLALTDPFSPALTDQTDLHAWLTERYRVEKHLQQWADNRPKPTLAPGALNHWIVLWHLYERVQDAATTPPPLSPRAQRFEQAFAEAARSIANSDKTLPELATLQHCLHQWYASLDTPAYRTARRAEERRPRENLKRFAEWFDALWKQYSHLRLIRVDLGYGEGMRPNVGNIQAHRAALCKAFHDNPLFEALLGYAWTLEWQPRKGFHYHFVFCFDGHQTRQDITLGKAIGHYWQQIVGQDIGVYFNCNTSTYEEHALGELRYHDTKKRHRVIERIGGYLTKRDAIAALIANRTFQTSVIKPPRATSVGRPRQHRIAT